tara:strand:- start:2132 stop:2557 length:426 start_codon:yes stop_codon:yes gene_type:complete
MPNYDATKNNTTKRVNRQYKDLDLDFGLNSVTKDVNKLTDAEAVKRSVRNLINTNHYERFFRPELGSGLRGLLFEPVNEITTQFIKQKIIELLNFHEPRIRLTSVNVSNQLDRNAYSVRISFHIIGTQTPVEVETFLERLR